MPGSRFERIGLLVAVAALVGYLATDEGELGMLFAISALLVLLHWLYRGGTPSDPAVGRLRGDPEPGEKAPRLRWKWEWLWYPAGLILIFGLGFLMAAYVFDSTG